MLISLQAIYLIHKALNILMRSIRTQQQIIARQLNYKEIDQISWMLQGSKFELRINQFIILKNQNTTFAQVLRWYFIRNKFLY